MAAASAGVNSSGISGCAPRISRCSSSSGRISRGAIRSAGIALQQQAASVGVLVVGLISAKGAAMSVEVQLQQRCLYIQRVNALGGSGGVSASAGIAVV